MTDATAEPTSDTSRPDCPPWCVEIGQHQVNNQRVWHHSRQITLPNPAPMPGEPPWALALAELAQQDAGAPTVYIQAATDSELDLEEVRVLLADLEAFAAGLRALATRLN